MSRVAGCHAQMSPLVQKRSARLEGMPVGTAAEQRRHALERVAFMVMPVLKFKRSRQVVG